MTEAKQSSTPGPDKPEAKAAEAKAPEEVPKEKVRSGQIAADRATQRLASVSLTENDAEMFGLDPETLDEDLHYRFGSINPQRQARLMARGYRPVKRSDGTRLVTDHEQGAAEDLIKVGDLVLMACPREVYEKRAARMMGITRAKLDVPEAQFRRKASAAKVPVTNKNMKGE